jgi:hypothetical protein
MLSFLARFASSVCGVLSGFDRLFFCGSLRSISYVKGLHNYLWFRRIPFKDFAAHSEEVTARLEEASLQQARQQGREIRYLNSAQHSKEDIARAIAARDRIKNGLICVLRSVDPCMSFQVNRNRQTHKLELRYRQRKCLHLYHYQIHPVFGFMHARIQTWFPFRVHVCINGREWLARQMDQAKLHYCRRGNTFTWLEDLAQAQTLFNQQLQAGWPRLLDGLAASLNPTHADLFGSVPARYYWTAQDSEWASDVMFRSRAALEAVYPQLIRYALTSFGAADVLRFLGQPVPASGKVPHRWRHEISSNLKERVEGVRIKHWLNGNSLKMYDKGSVLRVELTTREPGEFKVYRTAQDEPEGPRTRRPMRKGVVDLPCRAEVGQAANARYLEALAAVHNPAPLRQLVEPLCRPAAEPGRHPDSLPPPETSVPVAARSKAVSRPRRARALNPLAPGDVALLEAVVRHEFLINGLRNRDLRVVLYGEQAAKASDKRRQSAAVTRQLRLLRAHGLIEKVPQSHRYLVSEAGREAITALLAARNASTEALIRCAA